MGLRKDVARRTVNGIPFFAGERYIAALMQSCKRLIFIVPMIGRMCAG